MLPVEKLVASDELFLRPAPAGFSLIQMSIILTVGALILVSVLPGEDAGDYNRKAMDTVTKLGKVEQAMKGFAAGNGRLPCPADGQYAVTTANFGKEAANKGSCTGGTPAAPLGPDAGTGNVVAGTIPTKSLSLSDEYAFDEWGRRFTYVVDKRATDTTACQTLQNGGTGGAIQIKDNSGNLKRTAMAALVSHGPDGHGAWPASGGNGGLTASQSQALRINAYNTDTDTLNNASVNSSFTTSFDNVFVRKEKTSTFDDIVYLPKTNSCCIGTAACTNSGSFRVDGYTASSYSSMSVGNGMVLAQGDINGDGYPDLVIGAPNCLWYRGSTSCGAGNGKVYIVFGGAGGFPNPLVLNTLAGSAGSPAGTRIDDSPWNTSLGVSVAVGDVNGDGYADIAISNNGSDVYLVLGHANPWPATLSVGSLTGSGGAGPFGTDIWQGASFKPWTLSIGEVTGDAYADLFVQDYAGGMYLITGHANPWPATYDPTPLKSGTTSAGAYFVSDAMGSENDLGFDGVAIGDINGDGINDFGTVVDGARYNNDAPHTTPGMVYVIFGHGGNWTSPINVDHAGVLNGTTTGFRIYDSWNGYGPGYYSGLQFGDVNGDGYLDMLLDVPYENTGNWGGAEDASGGVIVWGKAGTWWTAAVDLENLASWNGYTQGTWIAGEQDNGFLWFGPAVDLNGDGIPDIIFNAETNTPDGSIYVIYGKLGAWSNLDLNTTPLNGSNGYRIDCSHAEDAGWCGVGNVIDINGDGYKDLVVSVPTGSGNSVANSGYSYVVLGKAGAWTTPYALSNIK
jgi:hypothetical protein